MIGLTQRLRDLTVGEQIDVQGRRDNIYMIARRLGIKVSVEKFALGFYVTRLDDNARPSALVSSALPVDDRQAKLAELRALITPVGVVNDSPVVAPVSDEYWIDDPITFENGEILYWHHKPKCKPVCYRRESDISGA